jgi:hypothetical protein
MLDAFGRFGALVGDAAVLRFDAVVAECGRSSGAVLDRWDNS